MGGPDAGAGTLADEVARLVRLVEAARDEDRIALGQERLREPARRRERGLLGEPLPDERELEEGDRAGVHLSRRIGRGRETDGWSRIESRHGSVVHGSPA